METLKIFAYFRIHPFIGITIVSIVGIISMAIFLYKAPAAYGFIPFGGMVTAFNPCVVTDPNTGICGNCWRCGVTYPFGCSGMNEVMVSGIVYCPLKTHIYLGTGAPPFIGKFILGLGVPLFIFAPITGTN